MQKGPLKTDERQKILEARLKSLGLSPKALTRGDQLDSRFKDYISTGQIEIDTILGDLPGIACGSLVEFIGESSSGKSYLAMKCCAEAHKLGRRVAWFNVENSFYPPRAIALGVQAKNADLFELYSGGYTGEQWGELIKLLAKSNEYAFIVVDSVTALIPKADYDKSLEENSKLGAHATLCSNLSRKLIEILSESDSTTVVLINQFRYGSGSMPNTFIKKSTGGEGIGFYCHIRLTFSKVNGAQGEVYNSNKEICGGRSRVFLTKNRFGTPSVKTDFPIYFSAVESDPIIEFIMKAKSKQYELISESRKILKYITDRGEIIDSKNPKEFIKLLQRVDAPEKRSKDDDSVTAFDFICKKLKFSPLMTEKLKDSLNSEDLIDDLDDSISDLSIEEVQMIIE